MCTVADDAPSHLPTFPITMTVSRALNFTKHPTSYRIAVKYANPLHENFQRVQESVLTTSQDSLLPYVRFYSLPSLEKPVLDLEGQQVLVADSILTQVSDH